MVLKDRYLYDTKARLTHHYHTVNSLAEELLSFTQYDQVGRMKQKAVGGSLSAPLQTLNYAYHIRGSLKALNDPSNLGSDLFGYRLYFEDPAPSTGAAAKYNGSISQMDWATKAQSPSVLRRYSFSYDGLDRLLGAYYLKPGASDTATGAYNELLSYDKNGNIKTLSRYGGKDSTPARKTDALTYTYSGGKLTKVVNAISDPLGYPPGGAALGYNSSGELISHPDKGLSLIEYNSMGLPSSFTKGALTTTYRYLADGVRLEKIQGQKRSLRLGDFHYETTSGGLTLQFVPTSEGYYDFIKNAYIYNYVDHLGNIRVSYYKNSAGALLVLEENHYYPFGQKHEGYGSATTATPSYQYKFGSKELQDTGFYDFGARFYMPDIGRWMSIDPLAEEFPEWSPYSYGFNNPLRFTDPTGMAPEDIIIRGKNNSSITIATDLVDISVNAGSVVGDLGGNYTLQGDDVLIAALDIVGIVDPTGVADIAAASLEAKNGNWGSALLSGMGVIPYVGDIGKVGKVGKHLKTIEKAIDGAKAVNGNSKASTKAQHVYEIFETGTDNVVKTGISGGKVSKADKSYRATSQVNKLNKAEGAGKYDSRIVDKIPAGQGARQKALNSEASNANKLRSQGQLKDKKYHQRP